jgi:DNA-binding response OmpR family regulator
MNHPPINQIQTLPKTYPSLQNAIKALNKNVDGYLIKPVNVEELLNKVKEQLKLQEEERQFSEQKVAEFIETRVKELFTPF